MWFDESLDIFQSSRWNYVIFFLRNERRGIFNFTRKSIQSYKDTRNASRDGFALLKTAWSVRNARCVDAFRCSRYGGLFEGCFWRWQYRNAQVGLIKLWSPDKTVQCSLVISGIHKSLATRRVNAYARTCVRAPVRYACVHAYYKPPPHAAPPANALRRPPRRRRPRLAE